MQEDLKVPKEQFLIDYFRTRKKAEKPAEKPFNEVLQTIQIKIEKRSLSELQNGPVSAAEKKIDDLEPRDAVSLLKESIDTLRSISGS